MHSGAGLSPKSEHQHGEDLFALDLLGIELFQLLPDQAATPLAVATQS